VRLAAYDAKGDPCIVEHFEGDTLRASRCAVGCTGVILSVDLQTVPQHCVEETVRYYGTLDEVLGRLNEFPLTQFAYVPFQEYFISFERERVPAARGLLVARAALPPLLPRASWMWARTSS
jgi:hypothetical protein